jgi:hypothetical protein
MTDKPKKLSKTTRALLTAAAVHDDHLIRPPQLPVAAARQVVRSLLNAELAEAIPAPIDDAGYVWRQGDDDQTLMLRATALGLACIGDEDGSMPAAHSSETTIEAGAEVNRALESQLPLASDASVIEAQGAGRARLIRRNPVCRPRLAPPTWRRKGLNRRKVSEPTRLPIMRAVQTFGPHLQYAAAAGAGPECRTSCPHHSHQIPLPVQRRSELAIVQSSSENLHLLAFNN